MNTSSLSLAVVCAGSLGSSAFGEATMSLLDDYRIVTMDFDIAWFDDDENLQDLSMYQSFRPSSDFEEFMFDRTDDLGIVSMHSTQESSSSETALVGSGSTHGTTSPEDGIEYLIFGMHSYNAFRIDFSIEQQTTFTLDAELFASSTTIESSVSLFSTDGGSYMYSASAGVGQLVVSEDVTLGAGSYSFLMVASMAYGGDGFEEMASFDGSLRVVPAPSALGLMVVSGLVVTRRRR